MNPLIISILLIQILGAGETDLFIPSFPNLEAAFNLSHFAVELLLTLNIIIYCICTLIVGSLGDKYGARSIIIIGLLIFVLGSVICVIAPTYWWLLFGRALQGVGIAAPATLSCVIISNYYSIKRHQELMGVINGTINCGMAFAPVIGSYVNLLYNWQGNFILLLIWGIICTFLAYIYIPKQENSKKTESLPTESINYITLLKSRKLFFYNFILTSITLPYWLFISLAPILYMQDLSVSLSNFGFYQGSLACTFAIFSFASAYLVKHYGVKNCMIFSFTLLISFIILTITIFMAKLSNPLLITLDMQLFSIGIILPFNILYPLALNAVPNTKEKTSGLMSFTKWMSITITIQTVSYFYNHSFNIIGMVAIGCLLVAGWCYYNLTIKEDIFSTAL